MRSCWSTGAIPPSQTALWATSRLETATPRGELEAVAAAFLAQAAAALEPYDVRLSLAVSASQLSGEDPGTGLTAEALNASVDRIWMEGGRTEALEALNASGVTGAEERLVSRAVPWTRRRPGPSQFGRQMTHLDSHEGNSTAYPLTYAVLFLKAVHRSGFASPDRSNTGT